MNAGPFTCPLCWRRSYHPRDGEERFCGVCGFVDDVIARRGPMQTGPLRTETPAQDAEIDINLAECTRNSATAR